MEIRYTCNIGLMHRPMSAALRDETNSPPTARPATVDTSSLGACSAGTKAGEYRNTIPPMRKRPCHRYMHRSKRHMVYEIGPEPNQLKRRTLVSNAEVALTPIRVRPIVRHVRFSAAIDRLILNATLDVVQYNYVDRKRSL